MPVRLDLTNQKFGYLTVLEKAPTKNSLTYWKCVCACGKETIVSTCNLRKGAIKSCGCKQRFRTGKKVHINGYIALYMPEHPRTIGTSGCVYEHVLVAEKILGRYLRAEEVVHHIDEDKTNNDINNLMIFRTKGDHTRYHKTKIAILQKDGTYISPQNYCIDCGVKIRYRGKRCNKCNCIAQRKVKRPSLEVLLKEVEKNGYVSTGKKYGVTDNAIRKWIKKYQKDS